MRTPFSSVSGRNGDRSRRPKGRRVGVRRELFAFYGVAALALIVVSIGALAASRSVARNEALKDAERSTTRLAAVVVGPMLTDVLAGNAQRRHELDGALADRIAEGDLAEVTIWGADGHVLYSSESDEIGQQVSPPAEVGAAINDGVTSSDFADLPEATTETVAADPRGFVEVYVPFDRSGQPRVAFEAYYDYARVDDVANSLLWQLIPLVLVPLLALQLIQAPIAASLARRVRRHEIERSKLLERTLSGSQRERVRIAADLHDGPIQDLAGIGYGLGAVAGSVAEKHQELMGGIQSSVQHAIESLRRMMVDLYPPDLSASQLPRTVADLAVPLREKGIEVSMDAEPLADMDVDTVTTLYRVARETLANVAQHSEATEVTITLHNGGNGTGGPSEVLLTIVDNGVGMDPSKLDRRAEGHLGLRLLIDRVDNLGGILTFGTGPDGGTAVSVTLPLHPSPM